MIGKTINSILTSNAPLLALVPATKMFPYVMNENTTVPALVYTIDSVLPSYNKGGWANDVITFSIHSFTKDYSVLQSIVSAIRTAFELNKAGSGTQSINFIYLDSFEEGYDQSAGVFYNKLSFIVTINTY
jgi:hypothetical protein